MSTTRIDTTALKAMADRYRADLPVIFGALAAINEIYENAEIPREVVSAWDALTLELKTKQHIIAGLQRASCDAGVGEGRT